MGGAVQQIAVLGLGFCNGVTTTGDAVQADISVAVGGIRSCGVLTAVAANDLKGYTTERFLGHAVHLGDKQTAFRGVGKCECLGVVLMDNDCLRFSIQNVAVQSFHLGHNISVRGQLAQNDLTVSVGGVQAVGRGHALVGSHQRTISGGDLELHAGQRFAGFAVDLVDHQTTLGHVAEFQGYGFVGQDLDGLWRVVQNISGTGAGLLDYQSGTGNNVANQDGTSAVGGKVAVCVANHAAVAVCHEELDIRQRFVGNSIHLLDQQASVGAVSKGQGDAVLLQTTDIGSLRCSVNHITIRSRDFLHDIGASL